MPSPLALRLEDPDARYVEEKLESVARVNERARRGATRHDKEKKGGGGGGGGGQGAVRLKRNTEEGEGGREYLTRRVRRRSELEKGHGVGLQVLLLRGLLGLLPLLLCGQEGGGWKGRGAVQAVRFKRNTEEGEGGREDLMRRVRRRSGFQRRRGLGGELLLLRLRLRALLCGQEGEGNRGTEILREDRGTEGGGDVAFVDT